MRRKKARGRLPPKRTFPKLGKLSRGGTPFMTYGPPLDDQQVADMCIDVCTAWMPTRMRKEIKNQVYELNDWKPPFRQISKWNDDYE